MVVTAAITADPVVHAAGGVELRWAGDVLVVGFPDSVPSELVQEAVQRLARSGIERVRVMRVPDADLRELLAIQDATGATTPFEQLPTIDDGSEGPIAELVTRIIDRAVQLRASDVHIEPAEDGVIVRIRVDGELEQLTRQPVTVGAPLISRLKVLANLNIVERRLPQDGQFTVQAHGRPIDIRLATVATLYGEKVVLRLLDTRRPAVEITALGMRGRALTDFDRMLQAPSGMLIAAGPTGAGKTTTMQCALRAINNPTRNVSTLEDPVEYVVPGINHIPVNDAIGAGFATQLRAILRQDPDVILIGEVRDAETARIGVQAALSGRLVLTSLHAQDAVSAISRLVQFGVEPHLVAASVRGVIAQRLVRRVCVFCAEEYVATPAERILLGASARGDDIRLRHGAGCALCRGTGFRDRTAAFQVLDLTAEMRDAIAEGAAQRVVLDLARERGFTSLSQEAMELARSGITTVAEAMRVVGHDA